MIVTKHADVNRHLKEMFAERKVGKVYWALGRPSLLRPPAPPPVFRSRR